MSDSSAIALVSNSLRKLLQDNMELSSNVNVTVLAPDEAGTSPRINLYLYQVRENPAFKNMDWQLKKGTADRLVPPPLSLNLFYLMTAYAQNDPQTGNTTAHHILGDAMRVFHEHSILGATDLLPKLRDATEKIQIIQNTLDLEELARVWSTFTQPFRLSVLYQVSVVQIDSPSGEREMPKRVRKIGVPEVMAPFSPPVIEDMLPPSGLSGSKIIFRGRQLAGWKVTVRVNGFVLLDALELAENEFAVTMPKDTPPGFNEIRVDISNVFRRTFMFEVTS